MRQAAWFFVACACDPIQPMPPDLPCREAGYAIAARTDACTGDSQAAQDRYDAFRRQYRCIEWEADDPVLLDDATPNAEDLFSCAFTIRNTACEIVDELGDDIDLWMDLDPGCSWVAERKGGE